MTVAKFDFQGLLAAATGDTQPKGWHEEKGPDSRCGLDYWYRHRKYGLININVDQGYVKVVQCKTDDVIFEGVLDDNEAFKKFVTYE